MPVKITNQEELQNLNLKKEQETQWFSLLKRVINQLGFEKTAIYKTMKPYAKGFALANGDEFDNQGRIWYKLTDEDRIALQLTLRRSGANEGDDKASAIAGATHLVVSMSPIDKFMCSTGHTFSSCMSLLSTYSQGFGFNLPTIFPNKGIYVCYLTKGEQKNYTIKEEKYRYIKMLTRNFLFQLENNEIGIGRTYPTDDWLLDLQQFLMDLFEKINLKVIENKNDDTPKNLKHKFFIYKDRIDLPRTIYFDDCQMSSADYSHYDETGSGYVTKYWRTKGTGGALSKLKHNGLRTLKTFIEENKKLEEILTQCFCRKCGKFHMELTHANIYTLSKNEKLKEETKYLCPKCLEKHYTYCTFCRKYHPQELNAKIIDLYEYAESKGIKNCTNNNITCSVRFQNHFTTCQHCGDLIQINNAFNFLEGHLCGSCYSTLKTCDICNKHKFHKRGDFMHVSFGDNGCTYNWHCAECYQQKLVEQPTLLNTI